MEKIKSNVGNTGIDIAISLGIISITLAILAALYFNTYITNAEIERRTQAINYAIQIFEKISEYYYSDVTQENFTVTTNSNGREEIAGIEIEKGYTISVNIEDYTNNNETNVVKTVTVIVNYKIGNKDNKIELKKFKEKETLITPNKPELSNNMIAVKGQVVNGNVKFKDINLPDNTWYNYLQKKWALARMSDENNSLSENDIYVWIPRYAYYIDNNNQINIEFLYSNKNQKVNTNGNLEDLPNNYVIDEKFKGDNEKGYWQKVTEIQNDETANRLNESKYGEFSY